jgi:hypothetical protein
MRFTPALRTAEQCGQASENLGAAAVGFGMFMAAYLDTRRAHE